MTKIVYCTIDSLFTITGPSYCRGRGLRDIFSWISLLNILCPKEYALSLDIMSIRVFEKLEKKFTGNDELPEKS